MHFRTTRKRQTEFKFKLGINCLTITNLYKYLGCILDTNLNYSLCIETLSASGQRALGSVITTFKGYKDMGIETYKKLLLTIVVLCGFMQILQKFQVQNLAICTFMGVHRFAPIIAVIGDCGWLPSLYRHQIEVLRYWNRLISMKNSRLTKIIFLDDFNNDRQKSCCNYVRNIMNQCDLNEIFVNKLSCNLDYVKDRALHNFTAWWKEQVVNKPKLRFYRFFKNAPSTELYLKLNLNVKERSYFSQLRFGILPIEIETGQYRSVPQNERKCKVCNSGNIEDEIHVMFFCPVYKNVRLQWFWKVGINEETLDMSNIQNYLLNSFKSPTKTAKYIVNVMEIRKNKLYLLN